MTTTKPTKARAAAAKPGARAATKKRPASSELASASVDPRLAARRRDVKRSEGRRRLHTLVALCLITLSSIGALAFLQSSWMAIDVINVEGAERTSPIQVTDASGIVLGEPLVDLDAGEASRQILALPWVASVEVTREWNGVITLNVAERTPAISLPITGSPGQFMLIDSTGRQLEAVDGLPYGFIPIEGLAASGQPGQPGPPEAHGVVRLLGLLSPERQLDVSQIVVADRNLYLDLAAQGRVRLGSDSGLPEKLVSLDTILSTVDLRCLWEIDVRVHTAPAVTRLSVDGVEKAPLTDLSTCT